MQNAIGLQKIELKLSPFSVMLLYERFSVVTYLKSCPLSSDDTSSIWT